MHESGIHFYNPKDKSIVLIKPVSGNKQVFTKRKISSADQAKYFNAKLGYLSVKEFRWIFQSQKIVDCPVKVKDMDNSPAIWSITLRI